MRVKAIGPGFWGELRSVGDVWEVPDDANIKGSSWVVPFEPPKLNSSTLSPIVRVERTPTGSKSVLG